MIALEEMRKNPADKAAQSRFKQHEADMGCRGLLVKRYVEDVRQAMPEVIAKAMDSVPKSGAFVSGPSASWSGSVS